MRPRIKVITLGVIDLERSLAFYRDGLGLQTQGIVGTEFEDGAVVFFHLNDDLVRALYPRAALAKEARISVGPPSPAEFSLGHIVKSKQEVDALVHRAEQAGARVTDRCPAIVSGEGIPDISRTWTAASGKSRGIPRGTSRTSALHCA